MELSVSTQRLRSFAGAQDDKKAQGDKKAKNDKNVLRMTNCDGANCPGNISELNIPLSDLLLMILYYSIL